MLSCPFLQITVKGVNVFKEEPAVILPRWVCFIQWENSSYSNKVLAKKAAGKMTEEERCAGSASVLLVFLRETRHRTTSDYGKEAVRNQPLVSVILYTIT